MKPVKTGGTQGAVQLSYGGWKPIGFSEDRNRPKDVIVTIDSAIASAPEAESDDLVVSAPALPPPYEAAPVYVTPAARPAWSTLL